MPPGLGLGSGVTADPASGLFGISDPTKDFNFAQDQKSDSDLNSEDNIVFTRASTAMAVNSSGNLVEISSGEPRYDYDKDGDSLGLLIEEESTNHIAGGDFTTGWTAYESNGLDSGNTTTGPDGVSGSGKSINTQSGSGYQMIYGSGNLHYSTSGFDFLEKHCNSVFAKKGNVDYLRFGFLWAGDHQVGASFNLNTGAIDNQTNCSASIQDYGNGWYRCIITDIVMPARTGGNASAYGNWWLSPSGSSSSDYVTQRDEGGANKYVYVFGAQMEGEQPAGPAVPIQKYPTSLIDVGSSGATRATDTCTITTSNLGYNDTGTFLLEIRRDHASTVLDDSGGTDHASYLTMKPSSGTKFIRVMCNDTQEIVSGDIAGSDALSIVAGDDVAAKTPFKLAVAIAEDDCGASLNGATTVVDSAVDSGANVFTTVHIGGEDDANDTGYIHGHVKRLRFWDSRLPNNQLEELSS